MDPFVVRNLVYGIEDSLISTTGLVVGIAASGVPRSTILKTGAILLLVEALSMAFGAFVSEDRFMQAASMAHGITDVLKYAAIMFGAYIVAGLVPMLPFVVSGTSSTTIAWAVMLAVIGLALLTRSVALTAVGASILGISIVVGKFLEQKT